MPDAGRLPANARRLRRGCFPNPRAFRRVSRPGHRPWLHEFPGWTDELRSLQVPTLLNLRPTVTSRRCRTWWRMFDLLPDAPTRRAPRDHAHGVTRRPGEVLALITPFSRRPARGRPRICRRSTRVPASGPDGRAVGLAQLSGDDPALCAATPSHSCPAEQAAWSWPTLTSAPRRQHAIATLAAGHIIGLPHTR